MFYTFDGIVDMEVKEFEKYIKFKLPKDYRDFVLKTNGGWFSDEIHTFWVEEVKQNVGIEVLFGFNRLRSLSLYNWHTEYSSELPNKSVIIGNSTNAGLIVMMCNDEHKGVYLWDHCLELKQSTEDDCIYKISDSFDSFFKSLKVVHR